MSELKIVELLKNKASRAYCDYIDQLRKPECLGWEQKVKSGKFGVTELEAHGRASSLFGKYRAYTEAAQAIRDLDPWIPVEEGLPEHGAVVQIWLKSPIFPGGRPDTMYSITAIFHAVYYADASGSYFTDQNDAEHKLSTVTHWQKITEVNDA